MNPAADDSFADLLIACDEAIRVGTPLPEMPSGSDSNGLARAVDCLYRLRQLKAAPAEAYTIGRFQVRRELGRGGFGVVFLAFDPRLGRDVALKVPRPDVLTSRELRERFHREARAAAGLDHPNIVPVFEAGEAGPTCYIASAYCPGPTLRDWLRSRTEPVPFAEVATLTAALADGAGHAHARGIVHRDLKPANVLLGAEPKITDFGLAKLADAAEPMTRSGAMLGTPSYIAPEQAEGTRAVGPATDVYALGVILYELLTGRPPFVGESDLDTLRQAGSQEPVPPSRLRMRLPRDLETICLKCLEKETRRRYATGDELAADLRRFVAGQSVLAAPPSAAYQLRKFVSRNRAVVTAAGLVIGALLLGIVGTTAGLLRANEAWDAETKRADGERAANEQIRQGNEVLRGIFAQADPHANLGDDKTVRAALTDRLTAAAAQLDIGAVRDPVVLADLYHTLGESLLNLAHPDRALGLFEKARNLRAYHLGSDHPDTLRSLNGLAESYGRSGRASEAIALNEECLRRRTAVLGLDHPDTIRSMSNLGLYYQLGGRPAQAAPLLADGLSRSIAVNGPDHIETLHFKYNLGSVYRTTGRLDEAERLLDESWRARAAKYGPDHQITLACLGELARCLKAAGRFDRALLVLNEVYQRGIGKLGPDHVESLHYLNNLGFGYLEAGRPLVAIPLLEESVQRHTARLGPDNMSTLNTTNNLLMAYLKAGEVEKALYMCEPYVAGVRKTFGPYPVRFASILAKLSADLYEARQFIAAEPYLRESLAIQEKVQPDGWSTFHARSLLGSIMLGQGKLTEAEPLLLAGYEGMKQREKEKPQTVRNSLPASADRLVELYERLKRPDNVAKWQAERAKYPFVAPPPRPISDTRKSTSGTSSLRAGLPNVVTAL
jgi:tetratricopeptide (TPR) repeat protein